MNHSFTWKKYEKDDPLPEDALCLGHYRKDGPLYVGRREKGAEVGKINTSNNNRKMKNLWTPSKGLKTSGEIFCGTPGSVHWMRFDKGDSIPKDAIRGGSFSSDCGDLYIGKNSQGEIGKITSCGDKLKLLYCHDSGCTDVGYILCAKTLHAVRFDYHFVPIVEIQGGKEGDIQIVHSLEYGYKGAKLDTKTIKKISAQASSNFAAIAPRSMTPWLRKEMEAIEEVFDEMSTSEVKLNVNLWKPFYLYQVAVVATMSDEIIIVMKRRALTQYDFPVQEKHFKKLQPN